MKKIIFVILILTFPFICFAQEGINKESPTYKEQPHVDVYHLVFKIDKGFIEKNDKILPSLQNQLFGALQNKIDLLALKKIRLYFADRDIFIMTYEKTEKEPEPKDVITSIRPDKLPIPLTLVAFFRCDFAHKEEFSKEYFLKDKQGFKPK